MSRLLEASFVEKLGDTLAGSVFAFGVLFVDSFFTAAETGLRPFFDEAREFFPVMCSYL